VYLRLHNYLIRKLPISVGNDSRYVLRSEKRYVNCVRHSDYHLKVQGTINLDGFEELLRALIREELRTGPEGLHERPSGFMDTKTAAAFLSTSEQAVRALCKREQLPVHRTPQGRLLFDPAELDAYVRGDDG
jgi:hypothetical protein